MLEGVFRGEPKRSAEPLQAQAPSPTKKARGGVPGVSPTRDPVAVLGSRPRARWIRWLRLAQLVERARHLGLDRLAGVGGDLGRERPDLLPLAFANVEQARGDT